MSVLPWMMCVLVIVALTLWALTAVNADPALTLIALPGSVKVRALFYELHLVSFNGTYSKYLAIRNRVDQHH